MTLQEFTERTGFYPDQMLYRAIENYYNAHFNAFGGNKNAFYTAYKENTDGLAMTIQSKANTARETTENGYIAKIAKLTKLLDGVREGLGKTLKALNNELEWRSYEGRGTNMGQDEYDELLELCTSMDGKTDYMSEGEAKKLIAEEFGFSPDRIEIVDTVCTYEINGHLELRESAEYKRPPLYDSSINNYIRFNVQSVAATWHYEMINGELKKYCC